MMVKLQLAVRDAEQVDNRHPQPVFDLEVHVPAEIADEVTALVMAHLARRNGNGSRRKPGRPAPDYDPRIDHPERFTDGPI